MSYEFKRPSYVKLAGRSSRSCHIDWQKDTLVTWPSQLNLTVTLYFLHWSLETGGSWTEQNTSFGQSVYHDWNILLWLTWCVCTAGHPVMCAQLDNMKWMLSKKWGQSRMYVAGAPHWTSVFSKFEKGHCLSFTGSYIRINMVTKNPMAQGHLPSSWKLSHHIQKMALQSPNLHHCPHESNGPYSELIQFTSSKEVSLFNIILTLVNKLMLFFKALCFYAFWTSELFHRYNDRGKSQCSCLESNPGHPAINLLLYRHNQSTIYWYLTLILDGSLATVPSRTTPLAIELSKKLVNFSSSCVPLLPDVSISM